MSRTTLFQLERGAIPSPRAGTLHRLAAALDMPVSQFDPTLMSGESTPAVARSVVDVDTDLEFDRRTNPFVDVVSQQFPELFCDFTSDDWDELYSTFGVGGALTEDGVLHSARTIARKRRTLRQLSVLLETHLADAAVAMIDGLFELVEVKGAGSVPSDDPAREAPPTQRPREDDDA